MAHEFPEITSYGSALRFALEAEQACADFAAAAGVLAPSQEWQDKLEEIVCTHDDRVQKLMAQQKGGGDLATRPAGSLQRLPLPRYARCRAGDSWPAAVEQLIQAEEDAGRYHEAVRHAVRGHARAAGAPVHQERGAGPRVRGRAPGAARLGSHRQGGTRLWFLPD